MKVLVNTCNSENNCVDRTDFLESLPLDSKHAIGVEMREEGGENQNLKLVKSLWIQLVQVFHKENKTFYND